MKFFYTKLSAMKKVAIITTTKICTMYNITIGTSSHKLFYKLSCKERRKRFFFELLLCLFIFSLSLSLFLGIHRCSLSLVKIFVEQRWDCNMCVIFERIDIYCQKFETIIRLRMVRVRVRVKKCLTNTNEH